MALTDDSNGLVMPVQPLNYGYNNGFGGFGSDWIVIFLIAMMFGGGWGGFGGFGGFGGGFGNMFEFPWLLNGQQGINANTNAGFNQAALQSAIGDLSNNVVSGFGDVNLGIAGVNQNICQSTGQIQNSLCQGFAGTTAAVTGAQNAITAQMYNNEIASLNRSFDAQTANSQNFNSLQAQLAQCCCDNRAATQDVKYTIATEACATRAANTQNTQAILDKLCQLELDGYKRENDNLRSQLNMANLAASQTAQTAQILAGQTAEIDGVYNRLKNCPVPSMPVYGNTPIFNCQSGGCGCGA